MSGVAELKAGPTQEQQQRARVMRERLLIDLQEQVISFIVNLCQAQGTLSLSEANLCVSTRLMSAIPHCSCMPC